MKFLEKINVNSESKAYIAGTIFTIAALFLITAVIFLVLIANKLDIVMTQAAGDTYTYFISIMYRILAVLSVIIIIPLTIYQLKSKNKSKIDETVSITASILVLALIVTFFGGEYYYLKKYKDGELSYSKMFCNPTIETRIFDRIIEHEQGIPPTMCLPPNKKPKGLNKQK